MTKPCAFCQIERGEALADLVLETEYTIAFLDRTPLFPGHTLLIPRRHLVTLDEVPEDILLPLMLDAQRLCKAVQQALGAEGTFVAMNNRVSQSVPHLHIHVVPRRKGDGLKGFFWPRHKYEGPEHIARVAADIRAALKH